METPNQLLESKFYDWDPLLLLTWTIFEGCAGTEFSCILTGKEYTPTTTHLTWNAPKIALTLKLNLFEGEVWNLPGI